MLLSSCKSRSAHVPLETFAKINAFEFFRRCHLVECAYTLLHSAWKTPQNQCFLQRSPLVCSADLVLQPPQNHAFDKQSCILLQKMLFSAYISRRTHVPPVRCVRFVSYPPQNQCFLQRSPLVRSADLVLQPPQNHAFSKVSFCKIFLGCNLGWV